MALQDLILSIMAFPQHWDGANLDIRILLIPHGSLLPPVAPGMTPFAGTQLHLQGAIIPGLDNLPAPGAAGTVTFGVNTPVPPNAATLFGLLPAPTLPSGTTKSLTGVNIKKSLPPSYMNAFPFEQPRTPFAVVGDDYACAIRAQPVGKPSDPAPSKNTSWGQLISYALRQPLFARALGLLYDVRLTPTPALVKEGGWVYVALDTSNPSFPYVAQYNANHDTVKSYAARLPALISSRSLFAAVLFPVVATLSNPALYDTVEVEAQDYDDGFAKVVHCNQPATADAATGDSNHVTPATEAGIQLGWDDEQVTIWYNRQLDIARDRVNNTADAPEVPLGVAGYRVDVREAGTMAWNSLCHVTGNISFGPLVAKFDGDQSLEPIPVRSIEANDLTPWLPQYFGMWRGQSLSVNDTVPVQLTGGAQNPSASFLQPVLPPGLHLTYGHTYEFRTRLADLTGGGPGTGDNPLTPAPAPITRCHFQRYVHPKQLLIETDPPPPSSPGMQPQIRPLNKISVWRPLLGYPEFTLAGITDPSIVSQLIAQVQNAKANRTTLGVNDPDVDRLHVVVEVRDLPNDIAAPGELDGSFRVVYQFERNFPALPANPLDRGASLDLVLNFQDTDQIDSLTNITLGPNDPLPIPAARDIRLRLTPLGRNTFNYWGAGNTGTTTDLITRQAANAEQNLYVPNIPAKELNAILLQLSSNLTQLLAQQLDLNVEGLTFSAKQGSRVVMGASQALRHTLSGDQASITFAALSELVNHWIVVIRLDLSRDWTWDGLADDGFEVARDGAAVGSLKIPHTLNPAALAGVASNPQTRQVTHLLFFDAVDPNPPVGKLPSTLSPTWTLTPTFKDGVSNTGSIQTLNITLPVAVPPTQTPTLAAAGIALSPYQHSADYSSSEPRRRMLWLEFAEPIRDRDHDTYFARVLAYGPDPLLARALENIPAPNQTPEPALPVDPELIRVITPGQSADTAGLDAMTPLIPSDDPPAANRRFGLPLPPGISEGALELFGFWTYELRVGHAKEWSTAQARFGRPLRVTGVQHPAPTLNCQVLRIPFGVQKKVPGIEVTAPYATPVLGGQNLINLKLGDPQTQLYFLLYTQVAQADGQAWRNILLGQQLGQPIIPQHGDANPPHMPSRDVWGRTFFSEDEIALFLGRLGLPANSPLSVLAVELLPSGFEPPQDPLGTNIGGQRILRASPLTPVPAAC